MQVEVVPYDPRWPELYRAEAVRLAAALGAAALHLEHVGSTSVPDLPAKPVIDIHLTVANPAEEGAYGPAIERLGYALVHREPAWFEHRMFRLASPTVNLHVFGAGCPELDRCRLFRDWLRTDATDRELYAAAKLALAARDWASVQDYAAAKSDIVAAIMRRAEAWRGRGPVAG